MSARNMKIEWILKLLLVLTLAAGAAFAASGKSYTGTVSDSMCGAKHAMPEMMPACTRACVGKGSKYALVVGDKVYTLETSDKAAHRHLDKQAGAKATVTGTEKDNTIAVSSVKPSKVSHVRLTRRTSLERDARRRFAASCSSCIFLPLL